MRQLIPVVMLLGCVGTSLAQTTPVGAPTAQQSSLCGMLNSIDTDGDGKPDCFLLTPQTDKLSGFSLVSFVASLASLALAVVAIWLSIVFYRMSTALSESTKEAAKGIGTSVEKLEKLFDQLYSDTFSMMKDTVSDIRRHAWGESVEEVPNVLEEAEKKADDKIEALREELENQVGQIFQGQQLTEGRLEQVRGELRQLVDRAIDDSRNMEHEAREETIRRYILRLMRAISRMKKGRQVTAEEIVNGIAEEFPVQSVLSELRRMREHGIVDWEGSELMPNSSIIEKI